LFKQLNDDEYSNGENFGTSVKLAGDTIVEGKPGDVYPNPGNNMMLYPCGSVCMFINEQEVPTVDNDIITSGSLNIYPNPTTGYVHIEAKETYDLSITDIAGNYLYRKSINQSGSVLDLSSYPPGIYFFSVKTDTRTEVIKVIRK
jgi:hypothetical protein